MIDEKGFIRLVEGKRVCLIHHWDTDGIASAAILIRKLRNAGARTIETELPLLGEFEMGDDWIGTAINNPPDFVITADICIALDNLLRIRDELKTEIIMFDHHRRSPVEEEGIYFINYCSLRNEEWPSNTLVLHDFFQEVPKILVSLGIVGDKGRNIEKYGNIWPQFRYHAEISGISFHMLMSSVDLLDSCYKSGRSNDVKKWPWKLAECQDRFIIDQILKNESLKEFIREIDRKIEDLFKNELTEKKGLYICSIDTDYHVISALTRKFSNANPDKEVMVLNTGVFPTKTQLYLRSKRLDVSPLISLIQNLGQSAGGKVDVVGAIIDNEILDNVISETRGQLSMLERQ